jgi:hypothetical protein
MNVDVAREMVEAVEAVEGEEFDEAVGKRGSDVGPEVMDLG